MKVYEEFIDVISLLIVSSSSLGSTGWDHHSWLSWLDHLDNWGLLLLLAAWASAAAGDDAGNDGNHNNNWDDDEPNDKLSSNLFGKFLKLFIRIAKEVVKIA